MAKRQRGPIAFVGRAEQLRLVHEYLADDSVWLVNIWGITGIGKSSFLEELRRIHDTGSSPALSLHVDLNVTADPLGAVLTLGDQLVAQAGPGPEPRFTVVRSLWASASEAIRRATEGHVLTRAELEDLASTVLSTDQVPVYLDPVGEFSEALADDLDRRNSEVLLTFDAYEKAPAAFDSWLQKFIENDGFKTVIAGQRPLSQGWKFHVQGNYRELELERFTPEDVAALLAAMGAGGDDRTAEQIWRQTSGYPLATTWSVSALRQGASLASGATDTAGEVDDAAVQRFLSLIQDPELKELLLASAGFIVVDRGSLEIAAGRQVSNSQWRDFRDLSFVRPAGTDTFRVHDVVQSYLFREGLKAGRGVQASLHRRVAEYWDRVGQADLEVHHVFLADEEEGYYRAQELMREGQAAGRTDGGDALASLLESAARTIPTVRPFAFAVRLLALRLQGRWRDLVELGERSPDSARPDTLAYPPTQLMLGEAERYLGSLRVATETIERGIALTRQQEFSGRFERLEGEFRVQLVELLGLRGLRSEARAALKELDSVLRNAGESTLLLRHFQTEHLARWHGDWKTALASLESAAQLARTVDDGGFARARVAYGAGRLLTYMGFFEAAGQLLDFAHNAFDGLGRPQHVGEVLVGKAVVHRERGDFAASTVALGEARERFSAGASWLYEAWVNANEVRLHAVDGSAENLGERARDLVAQFERIEYRHGQGHALFYLDSIARPHSRSAEEHFGKFGMRFEELEARLLLAPALDEVARSQIDLNARRGLDFILLATLANQRSEWISFDREWGPHLPSHRFDEDRIAAFRGFGQAGFSEGADGAAQAQRLFHDALD